MLDKLKNLILFNKKLCLALAILVAVVIFVSILFSGGIKPDQPVGRIFGKTVPASRYNEVFLHTKIQSMLKFGKLFNEFEGLMDLETETFQRIILLREARKRGLKVSDREVREEIAGNGIFYRDDRFDPRLYKRIIQQTFQCKPRDFEETVRESLLIGKLYEDITKDITFSDQDILQKYKAENEQILLNYVAVPAEKFLEQITLTEEELKQYYQEHQEELTLPPSVNVAYVKLPFPKDGGVQKEVETKYKAIAIFDRHKKSKDLSASAEEIGFEAKETGFFSKKYPNFDPGWDIKTIGQVYQLKKNEIMNPIELKDGWLIVKLKDKKAAYLPDFKDIKSRIQKILYDQKSKELAKEHARNLKKAFEEKLSADKDAFNFKAIAQAMNLEPKETGLLSKSELADQIGLTEDSLNAFYQIEQAGILSPVLSSFEGAALGFIKELKPVDNNAFTEKKEQYEQELILKESNKKFNEFVENLVREANLERIYY